MGKISNKVKYELVFPTSSDYLIGTDAEDRNKTKNFKLQDIADFVGQNVTIGVGSLNALTGALTLVGGDGLTITDNGSDTITISMDRPDYIESINGLIGNIDIVGSTNITITDNGTDTITVNTQNLAKTNEANTFVNDQTMTKNLSVGTTVFNVDSTASRVGVNTATPSKSFDIVGDAIIEGLTGNILTLKSPSVDGTNYILFTNSSDADKGWVGYRGSSNVLQIDNLVDDIDISSLTGSVKLSLGASVKLQTTATGVDVDGEVVADSHVTSGGTSGDFVKGDGSLDSTDYQGQIDAEEAARIAADSALQSQITTNATDIDNEESARISADSSLQGQIDSNDTDISNLQSDKQDISEKGQANGYAPLDSGAKVAEAYLPDSILGQVTYEGTWDASTNTPTLANPPASTTKGDYYVTSVAGTQFGIDFQVGDWVISNGTTWEKVDNTDAVTSVFGRLGNVVANQADYESFYLTLQGTGQFVQSIKTFQSLRLRLDSAGGLPTYLSNTGGSVGAVGSHNSFGFNSNNDIYFSSDTGGNSGVIRFNNTSNRFYDLPDVSGTFALTSDLIDTLDSVTTRGNTTTNSITVGDTTVNGKLEIDVTAITGREDILFGTISDSTPSKFGIANATTVTGQFVPAIYGYQSVDRNAFQYNGFGNVTYDQPTSDPLFVFSVSNTSSSTDPLNGILTAITQRDAFLFRTVTFDYMRIKANGDILLSPTNGNVGIGTTSPSAKLDVAGDIYTNTRILADTFGGYSGGDVTLTTNTSGGANLIFKTVLTERMRIDSSGNVGIGTSSPNSKLTIQSVGDATLFSIRGNLSAYSFPNIFEVIQTGADALVNIKTGAGTTITSLSGYSGTPSYFLSNVGIGTSSPSAKLEVYTGSSSSVDYEAIRMKNGGENGTSLDFHNAFGSLAQILGTKLGTGSSADEGILTFSTATNSVLSERMRIDSSGNVGIGTSSPERDLDIVKADFDLISRVKSTSSLSRAYFEAESQASGVSIRAFFGCFYDNAAVQLRSVTNHPLTFSTNNTERMRIDSSGNVGIGTSSPSAKLQVNGNINFSNFTIPSNTSNFISNFNNDLALLIKKISTGSGDYLSIQDSSSDSKFIIKSSGNVGIGTSSPVASLHVANPNNATIPVFIESNNVARGLDIGSRTGSDFANITFTSDDGATPLAAIGSVGDSFRIFTGGNTSERMRIDSSGNVWGRKNLSLNVSIAPKSDWANGGVLELGVNGGAIFGAADGWSSGNWLYISNNMYVGSSVFKASRTNPSSLISMVNNEIRFSNAGSTTKDATLSYTERMRIDSSGIVLIGKTNVNVDIGDGLRVDQDGTLFGCITNTASTYYVRDITNAAYRFRVSGAGTVFATSTTISSISDERLKENIRDLDSGLDKIMLLKPRLFDWKEGSGQNGKDIRGFIAQEVEEFFPELIDEWGNDNLEEGEEAYKSVRMDVIPLLVKSIQELKAEIETLKQQIN